MADETNRDQPGVTDDNPNEPDDDNELAALLAAEELDEDDQEEPVEQPDPAPATPPATATAQQPPAPAGTPPAAEEPRFTQAELERIIGERLSRDRKTTAVRQLEAIAGAPLEDLVSDYRTQQVERAQEQFAMTEDEAATYVGQQEELRGLKAQQQFMQQQQESMQQMMAYQQEKAKTLAGNPLAKKYEAEIDQFSGMGTALPFEAAMAYVVGQKVLAGEVLDTVRQAAQQQTLANVRKRAQVAPESPQAGAPQGGGMSPQERIVAARLGLTPKEYVEERTRINKTRARRG